MKPKRYTNLAMLTAAAHDGNWFGLTTTDTMQTVMARGYWNQFAAFGLRRLDRIFITSNRDADEPELGEVMVLKVVPGKVVEVKPIGGSK